MLNVKLFLPVITFSSVLFFSCNNLVKNDNPKIVIEDGTEIDSSFSKTSKNEGLITGSYVGMFEIDADDSTQYAKSLYAAEAFQWRRENKIALFIDSVNNDVIKGHTVVAGNNQPFTGTIRQTASIYTVEAKEPGTDKNDGAFTFTIKDTVINGTWKAFAKIDIDKRKYSLIKKVFSYDPNQLLNENSRYIDWTKPEISKAETKKIKSKMTKDEIEYYEEFEENTTFASASKKIYTINASNTLLTEDIVANLTKGDLLIIRNTIYARHGYSFKSRPLRVFFDQQSWYIPVNTNIKTDFTDIEKKNIPLLLKYEKLAKEYYDYFGRG